MASDISLRFNKMRFSLRSKIIIQNAMILILLFSAIFFIITNTLYSTVINKTVESLNSDLSFYQKYISGFIANQTLSQALDSLVSKSPFLCAYIGNKLGIQTEIYNNRKDLLGISYPKNLYYVYQDVYYASNGKRTYIIKNTGGTQTLFISCPIYHENEVIGCLRYVYPLVQEMELLYKNTYVILLLGVVSLLTGGVISYFYAYSITRPLVKLKDEADKIAEGTFNAKISISSNDEIQDLSSSFNVMAEKLSKYIDNLKQEKQKQKRFVDNVAHELKTPLTSIIGYSDILPKIKDKKDFDTATGYINQQGRRLLELVEEMLYMSNLGRNEFELNLSVFDIKKAVLECIQALKPRLDKFGIKTEAALENSYVIADYAKTQEVLMNILDNCIKHSDCTVIHINTESSKDTYLLDIIDNGNGISKDDLEKIFEPFYTTGKNQKKSSGLGLFIAREIMKKQNGSINIISEENNYTRVTLSLRKGDGLSE